MLRSSSLQPLRRKAARRTLSALLVLWLGLALQPCAMALGGGNGGNHDCPHCPPVESQHEAPCNDVAVDLTCDVGYQFNYDGRSGESKGKDAPVATVVAPADGIPVPDSCALPRPSSVPLYPGGPPLHVLHCIYLN